MTSVRKIAELAGVSLSTVSLVLNNKPGVSEQTRQIVLNAVHELETRQLSMQAMTEKPVEYVVPRGTTAQSLSIVVLHPPVLASSHVFSEVLQGIQAAAESQNIQLRLVANDPQATEHHVARLYLSDPNLRPDGILIFGAHHEEPLIESAQALGIPCVVLGRAPDRYNISGLGRDESYCGYLATQYLLSLGHSAVAFLGGDPTYDYVNNRLQGYRSALEHAGIKSVENWIQLGSGSTAVQALLSAAPYVTAVLFVNDAHAAEGLPVIQASGLSIPADVSVVSFDNTDIARSAVPPLTSVSYRFYQEGQWAVKMLLDQIRFPFIEKVHTFFKADLVERDSCAPPRRAAEG